MNKSNSQFKKKQPSYFIVLKAFDFLICLIIITLLIFFYASTINESFKFISGKIVSGIVLILIGPIAFTLPLFSKESAVGESRGDSIMYMIGIALVLIGIFTLLL